MWEDLGTGCKMLEVCYSFVALQRYVIGKVCLKSIRIKERRIVF